VLWLEKQLIYFPERYPGGIYADAQRLCPELEDVSLEASDGVKLHAWFAPPQTPTERTLLWLHGNAGNISHRLDMLLRLVRLPARVLLLDYRGYGKSEGTPSEEGLYRDARAAWDWLTTVRGVSAKNVVIFGKSLGGAPACELALNVEAAGLIVQSSFTSVPDMASRVLPLVPKFLVTTQMDSVNKVGQISCPKLFVHGPKDEVVPYSHGRKLFEAACEPKEFLDVPDAGHNETYLVGGDAYLDRLRAFLDRCCDKESHG
jgi:uncharacterized protein